MMENTCSTTFDELFFSKKEIRNLRLSKTSPGFYVSAVHGKVSANNFKVDINGILVG